MAGKQDPHSETAWQRAWRDFPEARHRSKPALFLLAAEIAAAAIAIYFSWDHGRTATVAITAVSLVAMAFLASALVLGALWAVAPVRQRDEARQDREVLLKKLDDKVHYEELDAAITERLALGAEIKARVEQMSMGEWERVLGPEFEAWDTGNIELLQRLAPAFAADYQFAEVPVELYDSVRWGEQTRKLLPAAGKIEAKLRSLRAIREQLRTEH